MEASRLKAFGRVAAERQFDSGGGHQIQNAIATGLSAPEVQVQRTGDLPLSQGVARVSESGVWKPHASRRLGA